MPIRVPRTPTAADASETHCGREDFILKEAAPSHYGDQTHARGPTEKETYLPALIAFPRIIASRDALKAVMVTKRKKSRIHDIHD
jgi:hypothetical protein